jgi:hypothetical protein
MQHLAKQELNSNYNSQWSENDLFTTSAAQIWHNDNAVNPTT